MKEQITIKTPKGLDIYRKDNWMKLSDPEGVECTISGIDFINTITLPDEKKHVSNKPKQKTPNRIGLNAGLNQTKTQTPKGLDMYRKNMRLIMFDPAGVVNHQLSSLSKNISSLPDEKKHVSNKPKQKTPNRVGLNPGLNQTKTQTPKGLEVYRKNMRLITFDPAGVANHLSSSLSQNIASLRDEQKKIINMSTYSQIYIQIVFAVKGRENLIKPNWEESLYKYITGIVQNKGQKMLAINGMPDHIHLFIGMKPNCCLSDLVREIKKSSNSFIKENKFTPFNFSWQEGYGAFSYSHSQINDVCQYILNQKEHHKKKTFKEEYIDFLEKFAVEYNEQFLFDWTE